MTELKTNHTGNINQNDNGAAPADRPRRPRFELLDTLRGILIIGVVVFHLILDLDNFGVCDMSYWLPYNTLWIRIIQVTGIMLFITISGICSRLSRNNLKRGAIAFLAAMVITLVTYIVTPQYFIFMGILHLLSVCMIISHFITLALNKIEEKKNNNTIKLQDTPRRTPLLPLFAAVAFFLLFAATFNIEDPNYGVGVFGLHLPLNGFPLYGTFPGYILGFGGFNKVHSADYFPLIPWMLAFFAGIALGYYFKKDKVPKFFKSFSIKPLSFVGRHSLLVYIAHQPIIFGLCYLLGTIA